MTAPKQRAGWAALGLLAALACSPRTALAAPQFDVLGPGNDSCGKWASARQLPDTAPQIADLDWVLGYVTAYNEYLASNGDVAAGTDAEGIGAWIDTYCASHPDDSLAQAAQALVLDLRSHQN